jgi:soluble cytochrome b562
MANKSEKKFRAGEARQNFNRMEEKIRTMQEQHTRLMQGMGPEQQEALKGQIQSMNQLQTRLENRVRLMNEELGEANPDAARVATGAREIEQTMNEYRQRYNTLASQSD